MSYLSRSYYAGNGTQTDFTVGFSYISKAHVHVFVDGTEVTDFTWVNDTTVRVSPAPANGAVVLVKRATSPNARLVDYTSPSSLNEEDLDTDSLQAFYLGQEANDQASSTVSDDPVTGQFSAGNKRITNVADPVNAQDAATKHYVDTAMTSQVAQAAASATAAAASATTASTKASQASTSATTASNAAASTSADVLMVSSDRTAVAADKTAAQTAATGAATSASSALNSANTAGAAQIAAEAARDATLAALDSFDDRYLGPKSSAPTLDNDGNALIAGALYFDTVTPGMMVWTGSAWAAAYISGSGYVAAANNGSEFTNKATLRTNIGLGNVDNTSDLNKPISTATQTALNGKQAQDADLDDIAALTPANDDVVQRKAGHWVNRTIVQLWADLQATAKSYFDTVYFALANLDTDGTLAANSDTRVASQKATKTAIQAKTEAIMVAVSDEASSLTTGTAKVTLRMPYAFTLTAVKGSLSVASTSGLPEFDIKKNGTTIFSTRPTLDANEKTTATAATPSVLSTTTFAADDELTFDIVTAGTGAKGLKAYLIGHQ